MRVLHLAIAASLISGAAAAECSDERLQLRGDWGTARFRVEIADTVDERALGLMNRDHMASAAGMLFIYDHPQRVSFWMANTLIPLDMLFFDDSGTVVSIHENAVPLDRTPIPGGNDIQYVLEINGGLSEALGLTVGSEMQHPGIDQTLAAWPCEPSSE